MNESVIPSAAIIAGSLARTYEYRTAGVVTLPQVRWTFRAEQDICCPVLVEYGVVYVGDKEGHFSAIDAETGDVLWHFAANGDKSDETIAGRDLSAVTATCLDVSHGYVACAGGTLYELDLDTGQVLREWRTNQLSRRMRMIHGLEIYYDLLLMTDNSDVTYLMGLSSGLPLFDSVEARSIEISRAFNEVHTIYEDIEGGLDIIYGDMSFGNSGDLGFVAFDFLSVGSVLWFIDWFDEEDDPEFRPPKVNVGPDGTRAPNLRTQVGSLPDSDCNLPIMDGVLYASCRHWREDSPVLVALDPSTGVAKWWYHRSSNAEPVMLVAAYGLVFLVFEDLIEAIDVQTHQRCWDWQATSLVQHAFAADALLYVFGDRGQISALDAHTGEPRWNWQTEQPITGRFSTMTDATLYVVVGHTLCALS